MKVTSRRLRESEHKDFYHQLAMNSGSVRVGRWAAGMHVEYRGIVYTILDFDANEAAPGGATAVLVSMRWNMLRNVPLDEISTDAMRRTARKIRTPQIGPAGR